MTNQVLERKYQGTSRLLSRCILLCNKTLGWPIRTSHGELGALYAEYQAHGATITLYGSLITPKADNLEIHLRIREFTGDMTELMRSLDNQITEMAEEPGTKDNRYVIFEESKHETVSKNNKISKKDHSRGKPDEC